MENKPAAQNIQDTFLNTARKERSSITIYLMSGVKLTGRIRSFDKYSVVLETNNQEQLIFKHAISTVAVGKAHGLDGATGPDGIPGADASLPECVTPDQFFAGKRVFVMFSTNHHHDCEWSIMCNAPEGAQEILMKSDPDNFYVPPYVGGAGWVGVRLDRGIDFATISSIVKDAHRVTLQKQKRK